jgi:hypothetical protein
MSALKGITLTTPKFLMFSGCAQVVASTEQTARHNERGSSSGATMQFEHDHDDPPPRETFIGFYYDIFNRWAEELARLARLFGFL